MARAHTLATLLAGSHREPCGGGVGVWMSISRAHSLAPRGAPLDVRIHFLLLLSCSFMTRFASFIMSERNVWYSVVERSASMKYTWGRKLPRARARFEQTRDAECFLPRDLRRVLCASRERHNFLERL